MGSFPFHQDLQEIASSQLTKALDPEEFRKQGHMVIDFIADYYQNIEKYPVLSRVEPGYLKKCLPESAPYDPEPISTILKDVQDHIVPGLTHWQSPNFFAYFSSTASTAGFLGEIRAGLGSVLQFQGLNSEPEPTTDFRFGFAVFCIKNRGRTEPTMLGSVLRFFGSNLISVPFSISQFFGFSPRNPAVLAVEEKYAKKLGLCQCVRPGTM